MKKIIMFLILLLFPISVFAKSSYIIIDGDSKRVLKGSNINEKMLIASTTKIMTCIIAIENKDIEKQIKVDENILKAYGSNIYIEVGEKIKLKDLLYGLMLRSGNDAALAIANYVSKNEDEFVKLMNQKTEELNMTNTIFYNPHGLEEKDGNGNTSTSFDMAKLMQYAMKNKIFREIVSTKYYQTKTDFKSYTWKNKNRLIFNYKYLTGGKTGFTKKARRTLVTSAKKDGKKLIVVTLNYADDFNFHKNLYEEMFKKTELNLVVDKNNLNLTNKYYKNYNLYVKRSYKILTFNGEKVETKIKLKKDFKPRNNEVVGLVNIYLNNKKIDSIEIYARKKK